MINGRYQFHSFLQYKGIVHGISSQAFGSMNETVDRDALSYFAKSLAIDGDIVCMRQIHSGNVYIVNDTSELLIAETDGLITNRKNLSLAVLTADCLPVFFYDQQKEVIAIAHAGYKGLLNHILENTVKRFVADFRSDPKDIIVGIGPCVEQDCYEVGKDRIAQFHHAFPTFKNISTERDGRQYLNLREIARQCLAKEGILEGHIEIMDICTRCDENFYSYRRGDKEKRFVSIISLVE